VGLPARRQPGRKADHPRGQGERIEVFLDPRGQASCGAFRWQPPVEFGGSYQFVFVQRGCDGKDRRVLLQLLIH